MYKEIEYGWSPAILRSFFFFAKRSLFDSKMNLLALVRDSLFDFVH